MMKISKARSVLILGILGFFLNQESFSSHGYDDKVDMNRMVNMNHHEKINDENENRQYVIGEDGMPCSRRRLSDIQPSIPMEEIDSQESILDKIIAFFRGR